VKTDLAQRMLLPGRGLIPALAGNNIQLTIVVEVGDRGGLARARIDHLDTEGNVRRAAGPNQEKRCPHRQPEFAHAITIPSFTFASRKTSGWRKSSDLPSSRDESYVPPRGTR